MTNSRVQWKVSLAKCPSAIGARGQAGRQADGQADRQARGHPSGLERSLPGSPSGSQRVTSRCRARTHGHGNVNTLTMWDFVSCHWNTGDSLLAIQQIYHARISVGERGWQFKMHCWRVVYFCVETVLLLDGLYRLSSLEKHDSNQDGTRYSCRRLFRSKFNVQDVKSAQDRASSGQPISDRI